MLIIPRKPIPMLSMASEEDQSLSVICWWLLESCRPIGVADAFRLVINNGAGGGQTVFHLHLHILAGRDMKEGELASAWPSRTPPVTNFEIHA